MKRLIYVLFSLLPLFGAVSCGNNNSGDKEIKERGAVEPKKIEAKEIPTNGKPTLIDFSATWCGPCKLMKPVVEELEATYDDKINFVYIDVDKNQELANKFEVTAVPTFVFLDKDGVRTKMFMGTVPPEDLENEINRLISK